MRPAGRPYAVGIVDAGMQSAVSVLRPAMRMRGGPRLALAANAAYLAVGGAPVREAALEDGSRMLVDLRSRTERLTFYSGRYEEPYREICRGIMARGGSFLDVGANIGMFSIAVGAACPAACCFCFEPVASNIARLLNNISLNQLENRVSVFPYGLSDASASTTITLREDFEAGAETGNAALSISSEADRGFRTQQVELRRLDDVVVERGFGLLQLIKVDIEGCEDRFLRGARETLAAFRPTILLEVNKAYFKWRGITADQAFSGCLPEEYLMMRVDSGARRLRRFSTFDELDEIENVTFLPEEKFAAVLEGTRYGMAQ